MRQVQLSNELLAMANDPRLNVWHTSLLVALLLSAALKNRREGIRVSRAKIMALSHITTLPTYHKYLKELQAYGYIRYRPSFHPGVRSEIDLLKQPS